MLESGNVKLKNAVIEAHASAEQAHQSRSDDAAKHDKVGTRLEAVISEMQEELLRANEWNASLSDRKNELSSLSKAETKETEQLRRLYLHADKKAHSAR